MEQRVRDSLKAEEKNEEFAFAVVAKPGNHIVGSTAYLNVVPRHRMLQVGSTWYSEGVRGTAVKSRV